MDMKGIRICHPKIWRLGILNNIFMVKKCEKQQVQKGLSNLPLLPWSTSLRPSCKRCPPYTQKTEGCWEESKRTVSPSLPTFTHTFSLLMFSHTLLLFINFRMKTLRLRSSFPYEGSVNWTVQDTNHTSVMEKLGISIQICKVTKPTF